MNDTLELKTALYHDDISAPEGYTYENVKTIKKCVKGIIDGEFSPDISKVKRNIRNGCERILNKKNGFMVLADKFRNKSIKHKNLSSRKRIEITDNITQCIDCAFLVAKKNSSPLFALHVIFGYLRKMKKAGHLNEVDFDIFQRHALDIVDVLLNQPN